MIANSPDKYKEMDTMELLKLLQRYHEKLNEYVEAAKTMDEQTFRQTFEKRSRSPAFQQCSAPGHSQKEQWAEYYIRNFQSAFKPDVNIEELSEEKAMCNLPELRNQEIELQIE